MKYLLIKRLGDFVFSLIVIILFFPLFLFIALVIKLDSAGPVFFRQQRLGKNAIPFQAYKFRTMIKNADKTGSGIFTDSRDPRITRVGKYLRKLSLDELPQFLNILLGDMSLIGPRPVPLVKLDNYDHSDTRRLAVKPGLTGWAQVNGRNKLTWPEKIDKDLYYIKHISLWLDIKIFFKTIKIVITGEGTYSGRYRNLVEQSTEQHSKKE